MARKKRYTSPPKVPRSNIRDHRDRQAASNVVEEAVMTAPEGETPVAAMSTKRPARYVPEPPSLAEQYGHVKKDLVRITIFGTLIFAGMFALKFMGI